VDYLAYFNKLIMPSISKIQRLSTPTLEQSLKHHDITLSEFRIVGLLIGEKSGYSQKMLAELLGISPPSLSVSIQGLERKGIIQRICDPTDQRIKRIRLSPQVDFSKISKLIIDLEENATRNISQHDLDITKRVLGQILQNISPTSANKE